MDPWQAKKEKRNGNFRIVTAGGEKTATPPLRNEGRDDKVVTVQTGHAAQCHGRDGLKVPEGASQSKLRRKFLGSMG